MLISLSSLVCNIWQKIQIHINTGFEVNVWMICFIPHIRKDSKNHSDSDYRKQVNFIIKTLFRVLPEDEMAVTQDILWTDYTDFYNKNGSFDGDEFIWKIKEIRYGNSHLWHQIYSLTCTRVLCFSACTFTSKVLGVVAAERSWGNVKKLNLGKDLLLAVMYHKNRVLFTHLPVFNQLELKNIILTNNLMKIVQVITGMKRMMILINS